MSREDAYQDSLKRGALVNLLGLAAKLIFPLYFVLATWMFGEQVMGLFFLASFLVELGISAVSSGFNDAVIVYGSHSSDDEAKADHLYRVMGTGFGLTLATGALLLVATFLGADVLGARFYPDRPTLPGLLRIGALSLPFIALSQIAIAATKAKMHMQYDALINGLVKPFGLLGFSALAWALGAKAEGLLWAHTVTWAVLAVLAVRAYGKHFDVGRTARAALAFRLDRQVLGFAIPQSLNMTFNKYLTRLDVLMLAHFGFSNAAVAFYATGALVTSNIREVKLIFSQALAPVAARFHAQGDPAAFEATLGKVSRWTTSLAMPILLAALILRDDLLVLVDASYVGDTRFMAVLLIPPFLSCAFGLAGNSIVFTGHSRWNLVNSLLVAGLNTVFNLWLIPRMGLLGAAVATALAASLISALQIVELGLLERIWLRPGHVWQPHLVGGLLLAGALLAWDPAQLGGVPTRVGLAVAGALLYSAGLLAVRHPEALGLAARLKARLAGPPEVDP
ncbi:MAG: polysaccharide biosynthesis C-terminal domain-containing protein [Myxococcales bacterium]|nr:polysaccharide biosynthesis C-terminal domain-containing protein [Myxococcales bacterium]